MTDILSAIRFWAALTALGLAALPLVYTLLRRLPDRGFAFARPAGLLLVAWVFWLANSLGFAANNGGGILLAVLVVAALSWLAYRRRPDADPPLRQWLRDNRNAAIATELLFAAVFALWVWVRAQNPSISATEKPMEFAFLNGVAQSLTFPPLDPWLSGFAISYYYFGYVMVSLLAKLALVPTAVAFNLAIAWIVAGAAVGAFGVVINLVSLRQNTRYEIRDTKEESPSSVSRISYFVSRQALLWGVIAALAVPIAGNLQIGLELLHGNGIGSDGLWAWLDVRDVNGPAEATNPARYETTNWWWWRTSRVIHEYHLSGRAEEGLEPIVEVPAFSFVLGDLHPHVLALPFAFLSMAVALAWWLEIRNTRYEIRNTKEERGSFVSRISYFVSANTGVPLSLALFTAIVLGGLSFLNTWDVAIHLFLVVGAFFLGHWFWAGTTRGLWGRSALLGVALALAAVALYLPFYLGFRSQAGPPFILPFLMRPTRLAQFLIIFGMPLLAITLFLVTLAARRRFRHWQTGVGAAVALVAGLLGVMLLWTWLLAAGADTGRITSLASELGVALPQHPGGTVAAGWGLQAVAALLPAVLGARLASPWLVVYLAGLLALVVMALRGFQEEEKPQEKPQITQISQIEREEDNPQIGQIRQISEEDEGDLAVRQSPLSQTQAGKHALQFDIDALAAIEPRVDADWGARGTPFVLLLVLTALLLTLGPEFVYLRDNFGVRLNTTFKFYYQAWAMFGVAAVFALDYLWAARRGSGSRALAAVATVGYVALLAVALLFPVYAVRSRADEYRGPARAADATPRERQPATLDGLAWLARHNPMEYEALQWLLAEAETRGGPPPVVLEAVGGQYSGYGRVSANTGLPTLLGWPGHEWQWRGSDHPEPGRREPIVEQIYTANDLSLVSFLLDEFDVAYIFVGDLEREKYGPAGLEKFAASLPVAFANERVTIYRWQPAAR